jgi:hypothetical protein
MRFLRMTYPTNIWRKIEHDRSRCLNHERGDRSAEGSKRFFSAVLRGHF